MHPGLLLLWEIPPHEGVFLAKERRRQVLGRNDDGSSGVDGRLRSGSDRPTGARRGMMKQDGGDHKGHAAPD